MPPPGLSLPRRHLPAGRQAVQCDISSGGPAGLAPRVTARLAAVLRACADPAAGRVNIGSGTGTSIARVHEVAASRAAPRTGLAGGMATFTQAGVEASA